MIRYLLNLSLTESKVNSLFVYINILKHKKLNRDELLIHHEFYIFNQIRVILWHSISL